MKISMITLCSLALVATTLASSDEHGQKITLEARVLTGVSVSPFDKNDAQPLIFKTDKTKDTNFRECFVKGVAFGDYDKGRVIVALNTISCEPNKNEKIKGYVVDSDGLVGLKTTLYSGDIAILARTKCDLFIKNIKNGGQAKFAAEGKWCKEAGFVMQSKSDGVVKLFLEGIHEWKK